MLFGASPPYARATPDGDIRIVPAIRTDPSQCAMSPVGGLEVHEGSSFQRESEDFNKVKKSNLFNDLLCRRLRLLLVRATIMSQPGDTLFTVS